MHRGTRFCEFEHLRARICRTKGGGCAGGLGFANSSTCVLEFAEPRVVCGWETRVCQFEHLRARICRTGGSRWVGRLGFANSSTCALEFAGPRGVVGWAKEGGGCAGGVGFANSSTCVLEFAEPRVVGGRGDLVLPIQALACSNLLNQEWWVDGETWFCQFEHLCALICRTESGGCTEGLSFAESSTDVLKSASPGWWQGWGSSIQRWWVEGGSSLQIQARECSNLQTWGGG